MSIGENVKRVREEQRYTQTEIARRCGVTPAAISGLEHGDFSPSVSLLARLAKALNVPTDVLLKERSEPGTDHVRTHGDAVALTDNVTATLIEDIAHIVDAWRAGLMSEAEADREVRELVASR